MTEEDLKQIAAEYAQQRIIAFLARALVVSGIVPPDEFRKLGTRAQEMFLNDTWPDLAPDQSQIVSQLVAEEIDDFARDVLGDPSPAG